ncbi:P-loop containing nucleoside triphosphate hydrolase protein [Metschnikowia bicuspidata]|uniref:RNA helicase n=1 Tax=Metschnikowia bicuspidata TaxID=27322 RepID=A0A4P9ZB06_9ASCO|nr:P-loop containing nucleoside triphosphate hydrolase protein [Metschnikowia bicuspidata]
MGTAKKPVVKSKAATLTQQNSLRNKVIKPSHVEWKPVELPDTLDDWSGFFGLEEIEGVDVCMVNGKPEYIAKEGEYDAEVSIPGITDKPKKKQKKATELKAQLDEAAAINAESDLFDQPEADAETEFTGFDDEDAESENEIEQADKETCALDDENEELENEQELHSSIFSALNMPLPDRDDIDLPEWDAIPLSPYLLNGLQELGFTHPTPIQKQTITLSIEGSDVIGKATTGSGKTLAYGLPILEKYISKLDLFKKSIGKSIQPPVGIIFAPTRELAHQVADHLKAISKYAPLYPSSIVSITGGLSIQRQQRLLSYGPGIIVATPGRFLELIESNEELTKRMATTDIVVLDEADRLLQDGHFEEFTRIMDLMEKHRSKKDHGWRWQTLVFSATLSRNFFGKLTKSHKFKSSDGGLVSNDEIIDLLCKKLKFKTSKPTLVDANPKEIVSGQVTEALVECEATERDLYLYYFIFMYPGSTLVFANSVECVRRLVPFLGNLQIPAFAIHSSMVQKQRLRSLERFKASCESGKTAVLVATDVAARGLDIPSIDHVSHYHLPRTADMYIHRSGRTARAGKKGVSVMFCSPQDASGPLRKLRKLVASSAGKKTFSTHSDVKLLPIEHDLVLQIRERVQLASKLASSSIAGTATQKESSWVKQAAEDLGIDNLSDVDDFEDDVIKKQRRRKEKNMLMAEEQRILRAKLKEQLAKPLRKNRRRSYLTSGMANLAHQIVTGQTSKNVLGRKETKILDQLKGSRGVSTVKDGRQNRVGKQDLKSQRNKMRQERKYQKKARKEKATNGGE